MSFFLQTFIINARGFFVSIFKFFGFIKENSMRAEDMQGI